MNDFDGKFVQKFAQGDACVGRTAEFTAAQARPRRGAEAGADAIFRAHKMNANRQSLAGKNSAPDLRIRRLVGAHRVDSDVNQLGVSSVCGYS